MTDGIPVLCYSGDDEIPEQNELLRQLERLSAESVAPPAEWQQVPDCVVESCQSSSQTTVGGKLFRTEVIGSLLVTLKQLSALVGGSPAVKTLQQHWPDKPCPVGRRGRGHAHVYSYAECVAAWKPEWLSLPPEDEAPQSVELGTQPP